MEPYNLKQEIVDLIMLKQEGGYWDFKREWYGNNSDLLIDIICMANNMKNCDAYIIIGIDEETDYSIRDITNDPNRKNTQNIVDFLREKKFAGGFRPTAYVQTISLDEKSIDILIIKNDYNTPYYLTENYKGVLAYHIYTRVMDSNTPKNNSADRSLVEHLWRKHFRLDESPVERVKYYLSQKGNWVDSPVDGPSIMYYKYSPEYTIEHIAEEDRQGGYEFYLFGQTDSRPHWYDINIRFHQTIIAAMGGAALDGGRYFTSTPMWGFIQTDEMNHDSQISYKYFIRGTLEYLVHSFFYKNDHDEARHSHDCFLKCVLIFNSENEKMGFEQHVIKNIQKVSELAQKATVPYIPDIEGLRTSVFKQEYANAYALKEMLNSFRQSQINH